MAVLLTVGNRPGGVLAGGGPLKAAQGHRLAAFSRGCFWGMEQRYRRLPGVVATAVGYMGGTELHPTYESIHAHRTGHVETVLVEFDPKRVSYRRLVDEFVASRPGSKSVAWTFDAAQLRVARSTGKARPVQRFWLAEERHQQYAERNGLELCPSP
ncbi:peptide-methionine (S)-S-oxide reductase [bacterium]|nr:MAG: peptide-methionine (S)-S-oxide reductase [bacterium]